MPQIDELLSYLKEHDGSDLHLAAGLEPRIRASGRLCTVEDWPVLEDDVLREMIGAIAPEEKWREYQGDGDLDFA